MNYTVKRCPGAVGALSFKSVFDAKALPAPWNEADEAEILDYCWINEFPDHFYCAARVCADDSGLSVLMYAKERPIIANEKRFGGSQYLDSCMEFFLRPFPEKSGRYLNIEINPIGTAHVGAGEGRNGRKVYTEPVKDMVINTFHDENGWAISFTIPNSLFLSEFGSIPAAGQGMKGNFYKCSGPALHEHYGCWNHIDTPHPDFHRPEFFGEITIE
ncbi:MAG: carbohydrate-binding family 9-like protein [Clostridia bacterium]|nr:carbohydrate-binding family 9-like protein [Clostridia bacterium]